MLRSVNMRHSQHSRCFHPAQIEDIKKRDEEEAEEKEKRKATLQRCARRTTTEKKPQGPRMNRDHSPFQTHQITSGLLVKRSIRLSV